MNGWSPGEPARHGVEAAAAEAVAPARDGARLARLEKLVEQFRVEVERFFNGALPVPPEELRTAIQRTLQELRSAAPRGAAEQFRLGGLEARFNVLSELYGRRLRAREEGRAPKPPARGAQSEAVSYDARAGIVLSADEDRDAVEALWAGLATAGAGGRFELDAFRGYIARQVHDIRVKTGSEAVLFRVVQEEGKLKLKAKPISGGATR